MDSNVLNRKGFSLIELSLVFAIVAVLLGLVFYAAPGIRQLAMAKRTVEEMDLLASASCRYYLGNGAYPQDVSDLRPAYLTPQTSGVNPFGNVYVIRPGISSVTVSTLLPKDILATGIFGSTQIVIENQGVHDLVSVTRSVESTTWNLQYDKKHIFHQ